MPGVALPNFPLAVNMVRIRTLVGKLGNVVT